MKKLLISLTIVSFIFLTASKLVKIVQAVDTVLNATITSGSLSIGNTTATTAVFTSMGVSAGEQTTTATIGDTDAANSVGIEVSDLRGTGVGWAATMTATNLVTQGTATLLAGSNNTVGFTGVYNGVGAVFDTNGLFTVEITTGGAMGVAIFKWTDPLGVATTNVTTAFNVALSNGITAVFDPTTYVVGDKWSLAVDALRYNYDTTKGLTVTPSAIFAVSGVTTDMTPGSATLLTGSGAVSNAATILTAATNSGMGDYFIDLGLSQTIHPYSYSGTYTSTVTLTVS